MVHSAHSPLRSLARAWCALALLVAALGWAPSMATAATTTDTVTVFATSPTAYELGNKPGVFTFTRTGNTGALTVNYSISGTATLTTDYTVSGGTAAGFPITGSVVIPDGAFSATVSIIPVTDGLVEGAENVDLTIQANPGVYIVGGAQAAEVIIADADLTTSVLVDKVVCYEPFQYATGPVPSVDVPGGAVFRVQMTQAFSPTSLGQLTLDFGGSASVDSDYRLYLVMGKDTSPSLGNMYESGRRSLNSAVTDGSSPVFDALGSNLLGFDGNSYRVTAGENRATTPGVFSPGDVIEFSGVSGAFVVNTAVASGAFYDITILPLLPGQSLPTASAYVPIGASVITAIPLTGASRWQIPDLQGYDHIDIEVAPVHDSVVEGAETVTCQVEASPDFTLRDPTVGTVYIADTTPIVSAALTSNAVEGSTNGVVTVSTSTAFPFNVSIPYIVTGTANYGNNLPNAGAPADYTMTGLNPASGVGIVVLPAGALSVPITLTATDDATTEGVETATVSLVSSLDYALAGSSSSSLNVSATINIADSNVSIVVTPPVTTTGTAATSGTTTSGSTTAVVRPLPTNSGSKSCGLGGGVALIGLGLGALVRLRRRRA